MSDKKTTGFDFSAAEARTEDQATLRVTHPKKGQLDVRITVYGPDSDVYQQEMTNFRTALAKAVGDKEELSPKKQRELVARMLSRIVVSWENVAWEGKELECNEPNAFKLFNDPSLTWLRDQVDNFAKERRNFLGN